MDLKGIDQINSQTRPFRDHDPTVFLVLQAGGEVLSQQQWAIGIKIAGEWRQVGKGRGTN